jgi:hypothetical protein
LVESVATHIAEGKADWAFEGRGIEEERPENARYVCLACGIGIANLLGTRTRAHPVAHASIVAKVCSVGNADRCTGLGNGDAGDLPAAKRGVREAGGALKERQRINVAEGETMALIEG